MTVVRRWTSRCVAAAVMLGIGAGSACAQPLAADERPDWRPADPAEVRTQVFAWLDARQVEPPIRAQADALWPADSPPSSGDDLLERVVRIVALADNNARRLVDLCSKPAAEPAVLNQAWLADPQAPPLVASNLRLYFGRRLAQESLFDEAGEQLAGLRPEEVADPAALLFYQAVVAHKLLDREAGLKAAGRLLAGAEQCPRRYAAVARLIAADLKNLAPDTLDHIARRMDDVRRRLDLGRAGPKVRQIEDGVIESLDKLIKQLEQQQQQQQAAAAAASVQPSKPAEESRIAGGKGPGEVSKRDIGSQSGWGDLPPKDREEALQQVSREFPSHYRDVIEQYFRKLASEGEP